MVLPNSRRLYILPVSRGGSEVRLFFEGPASAAAARTFAEIANTLRVIEGPDSFNSVVRGAVASFQTAGFTQVAH